MTKKKSSKVKESPEQSGDFSPKALAEVLAKVRDGKGPKTIDVRYIGTMVEGLTHRGRTGTRRTFAGRSPVRIDSELDIENYLERCLKAPDAWEVSGIEW